MKKIILLGLIATLLTLSSLSAQALTYNSTLTFAPAISLNVLDDIAGNAASFNNNYTFLSLAPTLGDFTSAFLILNILELTAAATTDKAPPRIQLYTNDYLLSTDLHLGTNRIDLNDKLAILNGDKTAFGIDMLLYLDRGAITFDAATLTGDLAAAPVPEPSTVILMIAGLLCGLPVIRRIRNAR